MARSLLLVCSRNSASHARLKHSTWAEVAPPLVHDDPERAHRKVLKHAQVSPVDHVADAHSEVDRAQVAAVAQEVGNLHLGPYRHTVAAVKTTAEVEKLIEGVRPLVRVNQHAPKAERQRPAPLDVAGVARLVHVRQQHAVIMALISPGAPDRLNNIPAGTAFSPVRAGSP